MVRILLAWIFLPLYYGTLCWAVDVDACIIGGGASGVQAAVSAEAAGLSVALFEKNDYIGGKAKTIQVDGAVFPMGAVTDIRAAGNNIESLLTEYDTPVLVEGIDEESKHIEDGVTFPSKGDGLLGNINGLRYFLIRMWVGFTLDTPDGYVKLESGEYSQPAKDWLQQRYLTEGLSAKFWAATYLGYGHISETPMLYFMKIVDTNQIMMTIMCKIIPSFCINLRVLLFQEFLQSMAATLEGQVFLSADITDATYGEEETTLTFTTTGGGQQQLICGSTIVAFAPLPGAIDTFTPPAIAEELQALTSQIETSNYYSSLLEDRESFFEAPGMYYMPPQDKIPDKPAENLLYVKVYDDPGTPILAYFHSPSEKTEAEARQEIVASYSQAVGAPLDESVILAFQPWLNYFPHAKTEALNGNFYSRFEALQGASHQYYVGGLFNYELVQNAMEHARFVVEKYLTD